MKKKSVYTPIKNNPILHYMYLCNLTKSDVSRLLNISTATLTLWIADYKIIRLRELISLSGVFGLPVEELLYCLIRSRHKVKSYANSKGVSYLEDIRDRHKEDK